MIFSRHAFKRAAWRVSLTFIQMLLLAGASGISSSLSAQPSQAQAKSYKIPDRVEVNYDGKWYKGTVYGVRDNTYKVMRDDYTSDDRWVTTADLRVLAEAPHESPALTNAPRSIPTGHYTCNTLLSGFGASSSTGMTLGSIRVVGPGQYTGLTKQGTGALSTFGYDPGTGAITWAGGKMQGFFGTVESSKVFLTQRGPGIGVVYRVRAGGNRMNLDCERDGS
jgi:hypothetical protein